MGQQLPKRARTLVLGTLAAGMALVLSGCTAEDWDQVERLAMPIPATKEAHHIYDLWQWSWLAAGITGVIVWGLIFYVVIRYRRRSETEIPVQTRYNLPIEIFYTIAPVMMVIVFFFFTVETQNNVLHAPSDLEEANAAADNSLTVVGQQWAFTFNYTDVEALGGETVHEGGTTGEPSTLWLVEDESVSINLYSPDVIHSFWVPAFLFKMDIVPGRNVENHFTFTPNRAGTYEGRCAELCGVYHSRMLFDVKVVSQAEYDAHMRELQAAGNTGLALGGSQVTEVPGLGDHSEEGSENGGEE